MKSLYTINSYHFFRYTWDASDYSDYLSVQRICRFLGLFLLLPFASNILKLSDSLISTLGTLATIIAYLLIALGPSAWSLNMKPEYLLYFSAILQVRNNVCRYIEKRGKELKTDWIFKKELSFNYELTARKVLGEN